VSATDSRSSMIKKISTKLILSYFSLTIILVLVISAILGSFLRNIHIDIIKAEMSGYGALIDYELDRLSAKPVRSADLSRTVSELAGIMKMRITVIKSNGSVIADSDVQNIETLENHQYRREIIDALDSGTGFSIRYSSTLKTDMLYYASSRNNMIIRLSKPLYEVDKSIASIKDIVFNSATFALAISIIMIMHVSIRISRPFKETLSFAADFASGNYKRRILNYSNDEIGQLQKALNTMADTIVSTIDDHVLEQKKLEAILDSINDGIAMIDSNKLIVINNNSFMSMAAITADIKNRQYFEVIRNSVLNKRIDKALKSGEKDFFEVEMGNDRLFEAVISPIKKEKIIQGILLVLHDISEKRKIEKMKSDLVSNVSHELKTPIAIIRGYLETVKENYDNKEMSMNCIERAIENADRQNALIQDIIKLSMIESVREVEKESVNIKGIIERCLELLAPKISEKEITLVCSLPDNIDYTVTANHFLVEEIFFNIIDNGMNYNNDGGSLTVSVSETADRLIFKISDTGVGIPEEFKDRIFERFYRVDKSRSRATGGTGLGLSIVKHAAIVLGWDVSVDSNTAGSSFNIAAKKDAPN